MMKLKLLILSPFKGRSPFVVPGLAASPKNSAVRPERRSELIEEDWMFEDGKNGVKRLLALLRAPKNTATCASSNYQERRQSQL